MEAQPGKKAGKGDRVFGVGLNVMLTFPEESWPVPTQGTGRCLGAAATGAPSSSAQRPRPQALAGGESSGRWSWGLRGSWGLHGGWGLQAWWAWGWGGEGGQSSHRP